MRFDPKPGIIALYFEGNPHNGPVRLTVRAHAEPPKYDEPGLVGFARVENLRDAFVAVYYAIPAPIREPMENYRLCWTMRKTYAIGVVENATGPLTKPPPRYLRGRP